LRGGDGRRVAKFGVTDKIGYVPLRAGRLEFLEGKKPAVEILEQSALPARCTETSARSTKIVATLGPASSERKC
jgi:hypothetical protein